MKSVILCLLLVSCVTPYQPSGFSGGYTDQKVGKNKYLINFSGNGYTSSSTARAYAFRRAKEVCQKNGYDDFELLNQNTENTVDVTPDNIQCNSTTTNNYYSGQSTSTSCHNYGGMAFNKPTVSILVTCYREENEEKQAETETQGENIQNTKFEDGE